MRMLESIESPQDLKALTADQLLADRNRAHVPHLGCQQGEP